MNFDLWKDAQNRNISFVGSGMYGYGVGRYMIGMGPQFVARPVVSGPGFDVRTSGVHAADAIVGFEFRPQPNTQFGLYGGAAYFQRNTFLDITHPTVQAIHRCTPTSPLTTATCIGFGGFGSPNSANRVIQEATFDWTQTFWRNPQYGAVLLVMQSSYVSRAPWFVPAGAPKNAHLFMQYVSLRYVLP